MLFVNRLQSENFRLWYVGGICGKVPVDRTGDPLKSWPSISAARLAKEHKKSSQQWGMSMGLHADNGKHMLALGFDICGDKDKETGKRMGCPETKALLDEYLAKCAVARWNIHWRHAGQHECAHRLLGCARHYRSGCHEQRQVCRQEFGGAT